MASEELLRRVPTDVKFFTFKGIPLAYSPSTGMCWKVDSRDKSWNLVIPGAVSGKYTRLRIGAKQLYLHRILAEVFLNEGKPLTSQQEVDHREHANGTHLQDRLSNLRICSRSENLRNQQLHSRNTSGYKGVHWDKREGKWMATIQPQRNRKTLGGFSTPEEAAQAYDVAAVQIFGEFALTNERLGTLNRVD